MHQATLAKPIKIEGQGLHTGKRTTLTLYPAEPNSGISFLRIDQKPPVRIEAKLENVVSSNRCVSLGKGEIVVNTVEHLLAALWGMGIDNALIEIDDEEVPALDGSASVFVSMIKESGIVKFEEKKRIANLKETLWVHKGEAHILAIPAPRLRITYLVDYNHNHASEQIGSFIINQEVFEKEIAPARTFGFDYELEELLKNGFALGGSLENAILITENGPVTPLRFEDELVRHKILDLIGDLSLIGLYPNCHIIAIKASHNLHLELGRKLISVFNRRCQLV
ncbi:UDP-3-O-[3-hydroxymyristoyl] N-acetylglucosamine deacetylase [bacterium]|nr:UDP-3-O-[3-hydroxymyristoyl] N-acetylglucosamine deacetylase [bacterium]